MKVMYFWLKAGVNFNPRVPWGLPPPTPNLTTCVNSQTGKSKQSTKCSMFERERKKTGITNFIIRSSVDDLLRHTPDAVIEPSTIEEGEEEGEEGGTNNLDHTSR